jgi:hypothetical protein
MKCKHCTKDCSSTIDKLQRYVGYSHANENEEGDYVLSGICLDCGCITPEPEHKLINKKPKKGRKSQIKVILNIAPSDPTLNQPRDISELFLTPSQRATRRQIGRLLFGREV